MGESEKQVFISYSWYDSELAVKLADSLSLYAIPVFLDRREIKVGDSIPERVFEGLESATHVIYLISRRSLESRWVKEELAVAKVRQLSQQGCKILPVLVEDVELPSGLSHIRYADLRNWDLKEAYLDGLREILAAIGVLLNSSATSAEIRAFRSCTPAILRLRGFADAWAQFCFQLERLWFYLFDRRWDELHSWVGDTVVKGPSFADRGSHWDAVAQVFHGVSGARPRFEELESRYRLVESDYDELANPGHPHSGFKAAVESGHVSRYLSSAEDHAHQLSALLMSILIEISSVEDPTE